jgi:hypothetical protein
MNKVRKHFFCSSLNVKPWPLSSFECRTQETPLKCIRLFVHDQAVNQ